MEIKDNRIIGWMKKGVLSEGEEAFCVRVYGRDDLSEGEWKRLREINRKVYDKMK